MLDHLTKIDANAWIDTYKPNTFTICLSCLLGLSLHESDEITPHAISANLSINQSKRQIYTTFTLISNQINTDKIKIHVFFVYINQIHLTQTNHSR